MGQYQQWLHYQEINKRLDTQVEALEAELAELQQRLDRLGHQHQVASCTENPILQALLAHTSSQPVSSNPNARYTIELNNSSEADIAESSDSISPALLSWGELPNFEHYEIQESFPTDNQSPSLFNRSDIELLPEDMIAFFDEHEQTDPQLELPWWLRKITVSSKGEQAGRPIDHNSIRTNRLVQRWIERWGRQPSTVLKPMENKEDGSGE